MANLKGVPQKSGPKMVGYKMPTKQMSPKIKGIDQPKTIKRVRKFYWEPRNK